MRSKKPLSLADMWVKINDLLAKTKQDSHWNIGKNEKFECIIVYKPSAEDEIPLLQDIKDVVCPLNHEEKISPMKTEITGWNGFLNETPRTDAQECRENSTNANFDVSLTQTTQEDQAKHESLFQMESNVEIIMDDVKLLNAEKDSSKKHDIDHEDVGGDDDEEEQQISSLNVESKGEENQELQVFPSDIQADDLSNVKGKTTKSLQKRKKKVKKSSLPKIVKKRYEKEENNRDHVIEKVKKKPPGRRPTLWPMLNMNEQGRYLCPISSCGKHYRQKTSAWGHYRRCHTEPQDKIKCSKCPLQFTAQFELKFHEDLVHNLNNGHLVCSTCGMRFQQQSSLKYHENRFHPPPEEAAANDKEKVAKQTVSKCCFCKKSFSKLIYKHLHLFEAHKDQIWHCSICTQPFTSERSLYKHMRKIHQTEPVIYNCKYCEKTFTNENRHSYHLDRFHPEEDLDVEKPFICPVVVCQRRFRSSVNLDMHSKTHKSSDQRLASLRQGQAKKANIPHKEKIKKIPCETCGKWVQERNMKQHCLTHADSRQYACNLCDKTYPIKRSLVQHKLEVHIKRELFCPVETCKKVFHNKTVLYQHMDMHSGVKQKCPQCEKEFVYRRDLNAHIRGVHEGRKSYCSFCQKEFTRGPEKNRHERRCHLANNSEPAK